MNTFRIKKSYNTFLKKEFLKKTLCFQDHVGHSFSSELYFEKKAKSRSIFIFSNFSAISNKKHKLFPLLSGKQNLCVPFSNKTNSAAPVFFNFSFDKNRLKNVVAWFLERYGQYKTIQLLENLKEFGFGYATKAGLSLGIDDLKIPNKKIALLSKAETKVSKDLMDYRNSKITGIERTQRLIYTWNQTNDMLKQEVIKYFETMDLFNPIYMMAFSGARGNMSQVRQLVGMRGLMSDPQGQIIDFPIQSNFREGLTLTEYLISTYGARKGIVDTALRTATAGYLTRRLVDVAQHVIVSQFDCKTSRGIFLFDMKEANKTIYSFQNRLVGRVLAQDIFSTKSESLHDHTCTDHTAPHNFFSLRESGARTSTEKTLIASRNQEIDSKLAFAISKVTKKAFVRSPLTCETPRLVCQLCYGWSLSQGKLVSVGEAVGVIAAQSIGEPGTQLTMRTFHTGGVFAGGLTDQILAPFDGKIQYFHNIPGSCVRISLSEIAFFTKMPGSFFVIRDSAGAKGASVLQKKESNDLTFTPYSDQTYLLQVQNDWKYKNRNSCFSEIYKIPAFSVLFMRNHEYVQKKQVLAQFSTVANKQFQYGSAEQTLYSALSGEFYLNTSIIPFQKKNEVKNFELIVETRNSDCFDRFSLEFKNDILWKFKDWTNIWILSGKVLYNSFDSKLFIQEGDFLKKTSVFHRILWKKTKNWNLMDFQKEIFHKQTKNRFYLMASEIHKNSQSSTFSNFISNTPVFVSELKSPNTTTSAVKCLSFMNGWTSSLKPIDLKKHNFPEKSARVKTKHSVGKSNFTWKTGSNVFSFKNKAYSNQKYKHVFSKHQTNYTKKQDSSFLDKGRIFQFHFFQLEPFSTNFVNFHKKQNFKHKKFFNPKRDIVFSGTFQKYFVFSSQKKLYTNIKTPFRMENIEQQKPYIGIHSKQKKALKQIFFQFSTFGQSSPFFQVYNFAKKFNLSQKFIKFPQLQKQNYFLGWRQANKKKNWDSIFLLSKKETNFDSKNLTNPFFFAKMQKPIKQHQKFISIPFTKHSTANKSLFSFVFEKKALNSKDLKASNKFFLQNFAGSSSHYHVTQCDAVQHDAFKEQACTPYPHPLPPPQRGRGGGRGAFRRGTFRSAIEETTESQQIGFKKILIGLQYEKVRYKKFGYVFSFSDWSKKNVSQHSLRTFTTLQQTSLGSIRGSENQKVNFGKKQKGVFVGNENFFGKDSPRLLSFCFPKNYQTLTNGIFNILMFENSSKKQKFTQFLCLKQKSFFFDFLAKEKFVNTQKTAFGKTRKQVITNSKNLLHFENSSFQQKKVTFLVPTPFDAVPKKNTSLLTERTVFYASHPFADFTHLFQYSCKNNFHLQKQKHFYKNFSFCFKKHKTSQLLMRSVKEPTAAKDLSSFLFFGLETLQNNKIFNKVNNSQIYTEEIFWLPQENYTFSILDFDQVVKKKFSVESGENLEKLSVPQPLQTIQGLLNTESYVSNQILKKTPFFYSSNRQGKKKAYFPMFEGIWNWSFSNKGKYQNSFFGASNTTKKMATTKKRVIEQKISFYKDRNQKQLFARNVFCSTAERVPSPIGCVPSPIGCVPSPIGCVPSPIGCVPQGRVPQGKGLQAHKRKILAFPFFSIKRHQKRTIVQKLYLQNKSSFKFLQWKFFFKNFHKRINMKNSSFFQQKKRKFVKRVSKVYFANKINRKLTKNFISQFQNKKPFAKQKVKKLFTIKVQNAKFSPMVKIQKKVGQFVNSHCFTCLPYQKVENSILFSKNSLKNQFKEQDKMSVINNKNLLVSFQKFKPLVLQHQQMHIKIQSGWICFFPNSSFVANWHQSIANQGHFFGKDLCFEQNKILRETVILNSLSVSFYAEKAYERASKQAWSNAKKVQKEFYSNLHPFGFKQHKRFAKSADKKISFSFDVDTQATEKKNSFSIESIKRNLNCRFQNDATSYAIENFCFADFASDSANTTSHHSLISLISAPRKTTLALFIRPMQYKLVENSKNYKSLFFNATIQNPSLQKNSISFVSSLKMYKKYHSNILNCQKPEKIFLHNIKNVYAVIRSAFEKMHAHTKFKQNSKFSRMSFFKNYTNQFKKNLSFSNFGLSKKDTIKKLSAFQPESKKFFVSKFQNLLYRHISRNPVKANAKNQAPAQRHVVIWGNARTPALPSPSPSPSPKGMGIGRVPSPSPKGMGMGIGNEHTALHRSDAEHKRVFSASFAPIVKRFSTAQQNFYNNDFQKNYFISFHPIQFLPLSVSHSSWTNSDIGFKTSESRALLFFNPINMTIDFSICQSKAAFLNQRVFSKNLFKKYVQTSSFWLNKDGLNFVVPSIVSENTSQNFWKTSSFSKNLPYFMDAQKNSKIHSLTAHTKQNQANINFKVKNKNSKTKIQVYKTFIFQNSQSFYANTKIFSPFQGELISMHMNETNWWKKASEISTIQKLNNLFSVVRKQDLFAIDFSNPESKKAKRKLCTLAHEHARGTKCIAPRHIASPSPSPKGKGMERDPAERAPSPLGRGKERSHQMENLTIAQQNGNTKSVLLQKDENNAHIRVKYDLKNKQQHLMELYQSILKTQQPVLFVNSAKKPEYIHQISSFITKYENKLYKLKNLKIGYPLLSKNPSLGKFLVYGDCLDNFAIRKPGQIVHLSCFKVTLRRGQPFLVSPNGILHLANTPFIQKNVPILTLPYQTVQSGDIVQGIPKVEQLFEARTTIQGRLFLSSLPILLKGIFERYKSMLPLEQAVRQSFLKIQQLIVDGVQRVYRSQGVSIVDKHLEVIVRQMTTKVQIIHGAQTGFFPGELVNLNLVERINKFLLVKIRYEPVVLGITRASLEVESFLSASSFQQTTKILSLAAISRKKDFLKGLKENILVGNLIPSGTGYMVLRKNA